MAPSVYTSVYPKEPFRGPLVMAGDRKMLRRFVGWTHHRNGRATAGIQCVTRIRQIVRPRGAKLHDRRKLEAFWQVDDAAHGHVVPLVIGRRSPLITRKRLGRERRLVPERAAARVIGVSPSQRVVCGELEAMGHALAEAEIEAVVVRTANRFVVTNACELRQGRARRSKSIQRSRAASSTDGYALIDVNGLVLVPAENVCVLCLKHCVGIHRPAIPAVELLRDRSAIVGVHPSSETPCR